MLRRLQRILSPAQHRILKELIPLCSDPLYLVGGPVRDILLGRRVLDQDFAVEGDAGALAARLATKLGGKLTVHPRFSTAKIVFPDGTVVDLAQTRKEYYPDPARLPIVLEPGAPIREDLARRDFSINAMALRLNGPAAGEIVDPFDGRRDLKRRLIRILHADSFRDDPVRAFRAVRYAVRYGCRLDPSTQRALRELLAHPDYLKTASDRIFDEWRRSFEERKWIETQRALLKSKLPAWLGTRETSNLRSLSVVDKSPLPPAGEGQSEGAWIVRWLAFLSLQPNACRLRIASRMPFPRAVKKIFADPIAPRRALKILNAGGLKPSRAVELLAHLPPEWLVVLSAICSRRGRTAMRAFITTWRHIPPPATGDDLRRWGIPPGPHYPKILKRLHAAKLDGRIRTEQDIRRIAFG